MHKQDRVCNCSFAVLGAIQTHPGRDSDWCQKSQEGLSLNYEAFWVSSEQQASSHPRTVVEFTHYWTWPWSRGQSRLTDVGSQAGISSRIPINHWGLLPGDIQKPLDVVVAPCLGCPCWSRIWARWTQSALRASAMLWLCVRDIVKKGILFHFPVWKTLL